MCGLVPGLAHVRAVGDDMSLEPYQLGLPETERITGMVMHPGLAALPVHPGHCRDLQFKLLLLSRALELTAQFPRRNVPSAGWARQGHSP